jgi:cytochrome b pre-mRNA-processing protein 3
MLKILGQSSFLFNTKRPDKLVNVGLFFHLRHTSIILSSALSTKPSDIIDPSLAQNLPAIVKPKILTRIKEAFGFQGSYRYSQQNMALSGIRLYLCIHEQIDYNRFFELCQARDVFASFCLITFLHVWMISVRLAQEGRSGDFIKQQMIQAMWDDITKRASIVSKMSTNVKNTSYEKLSGIFQASLFGYDEGILSNDCILAAALWRHLLEMRDIEDFRTLNILCDYVRKNIKHFDEIHETDVLRHGFVSFVSLDKQSVDHSIVREKLLKFVSTIN